MAGLLSTMLAGTASAEHVDCGDVITTDTTLDSDVGPCPGHGLIVRGNGITLDLAGHTVFAANGPEETVGILLANVTGVTVQNGTVEGFDAGVAISGGQGNTVRRITAQNNVNDMLEPFPFTPGTPVPPEQQPLMHCDYGDGITTFASDNNLIEHNRVIGNGPYAGISLVDESDDNVLRKNTVLDNNIPNLTTRNDGTFGTGLCGATLAGAPGMQRGRAVQAIGIRIEGPGANDNLIEGNRVDNSALVGISIHSYVCEPEPGEPRVGQQPNVHNLITANRVRFTGAETATLPEGDPGRDPFADGISSLAQGPIGGLAPNGEWVNRVTCTSPNNTIVANNSSDNMRHGISLHLTTQGNVVNDNVANKNVGDGIFVAGPRTNRDRETGEVVSITPGATNNTLIGNRAHRNAEHDGHDDNPDCDNNNWLRNRFLTVNQPCVANGGTGWVGGPGQSGDAPGRNTAATDHGRE